MPGVYNVGIYCRLSVHDASNTQKHNHIEGDESTSMENQRALLSQFVLMQGWIETKVYLDDGFSGGNFNRPGFNQMIKDAENGVINLILCHDLSRFGRDYIEVGRYTDVLFPLWGCRFIALLDEVDTAKDDNDMMHFRSLMNDYYLRDLSHKIKAVFSAKAQKTGYLNGRPPYGYLRKEEKSHLLVPEPVAASVIQRIYDLRAAGASYNTIARTLNSDGVPTPLTYWAARNRKTLEKPCLWYVQVVKNILRCEVYIGTLVNNKKPSLSHKSDQRRYTEKSEWIRHENAHEALIQQEVWDKVQAIELATIEKGKKQAKRKPALFGSKLFCIDCGTSLAAQTVGHTKNGVWRKEGTNYSCHRHLMTGRSVCSNHTIGEKPLTAVVLGELKIHAQNIALDENALLKKLEQQIAPDNLDEEALLQRELRRLKSLLEDSIKIASKLYEDKIAGNISLEIFEALMEKNELARQNRQAQLDETATRLADIKHNSLCVSQWVALIKKHSQITTLTRADVNELIERIEVGESDYSSGKRVQELRIYWRFAGQVDCGAAASKNVRKG